MGNIAVRNFMLTAIALLICLIIMCSLLLVNLYNYSVDNIQGNLEDAAEFVSAFYLPRITDPWKIDDSAFVGTLKSIAYSNHIRIMLTDRTGSIQLYVDPYTQGSGGTIDGAIVSLLSQKKMFYEVGTLDGYYENKLMTVAVPVLDDLGNFRGIVVASAPTDSIKTLFRSFMKGVLSILVFVILIAFAIIYFVSAKLSKPLHDMSAAARKFAMGDFKTRVRVRGGPEEIQSLAAAFNNMAESMQKLDEQRGAFISDVSHELKTPMTSISGFIDGILDGTIPEERQRHYLEIVRAEVQRLSRLVGKLLLTSRLETNTQELNMRPVDLCDLIGAAALGMESAVEKKNISVNIDLPADRLYVLADPDALTQIVTNLLDNAVKYGEENGKIEVTVRKKGDAAAVSVYNTGQGISPDDLPHVFDRFYKADRSRGLDKESNGLGLYIVKSLLSRMNRVITAESEEGKYARFTFTLELAKIQSAGALKD